MYRVPGVKETCMLVAWEFVLFWYHIIILVSIECLGVGIFEGHFFIFANPQICHRPQKDAMHLSTQVWVDIVYAYGIVMGGMLTDNPFIILSVVASKLIRIKEYSMMLANVQMRLCMWSMCMLVSPVAALWNPVQVVWIAWPAVI